MNSKFWFYTNYITIAKSALNPDQYYNYLDAIVSYGTKGEADVCDPIAEALFAQVKPSIDASKQRYNRAVKNGSKGGRPPKITRRHIVAAIDRTKSDNPQILAIDLGCSSRAILNYYTVEQLRELKKWLKEQEWYKNHFRPSKKYPNLRDWLEAHQVLYIQRFPDWPDIYYDEFEKEDDFEIKYFK